MKDPSKDLVEQIRSTIRLRDYALSSILPSIEPMLNSIEAAQQTLITTCEAIAPIMEQLEATQYQFAQLLATTTLNPAMQNAIDQMQLTITPMMREIQKTARFFQDYEEQQKVMGKRTRELIEELAKSKEEKERRIHELEERVDGIERALKTK